MRGRKTDEGEESDRQKCTTWLVSCLLIRMQISCIEKHLRAFHGSFSSLHISPPFFPFFFSSFTTSSLLAFDPLVACYRTPLVLFEGTFLLSTPLLCPHFRIVLIFLPFHSLLEDLFPVVLLPLSLFFSQSCYLFPFLFIQMTIWGFVWSLWNWLCGPEVDLTGGCMFSLVWTRLLFMLQRIKTAEWVFLFLHHLCPNVSQQQLMLQWRFCQQKSPPEYIIPIITVFFFSSNKRMKL